MHFFLFLILQKKKIKKNKKKEIKENTLEKFERALNKSSNYNNLVNSKITTSKNDFQNEFNKNNGTTVN